MSWKRGLTRLYLVLWALRLPLVAALSFGLAPFFSLDRSFAVFAVLVGSVGVVIPALRLLALRWVISGFES